MNLGVTSVAAPNAASSRTARYSSPARPAAAGGRPAVPSTRVRSLASAWIRLASTAKPSPPTNPSSMQRCRTVSNKRRSRSLSRKRPCRFFEKVEMIGNLTVEAQTAEPDQQLRVDRRPTHLAVERRQLLPQPVEFDEPVNRSQK